jgi:hypothetical protein
VLVLVLEERPPSERWLSEGFIGRKGNVLLTGNLVGWQHRRLSIGGSLAPGLYFEDEDEDEHEDEDPLSLRPRHRLGMGQQPCAPQHGAVVPFARLMFR